MPSKKSPEFTRYGKPYESPLGSRAKHNESGYAMGCRCDTCRPAWASYRLERVRKYREERRLREAYELVAADAARRAAEERR